jgi:hypothetical protein
MLPEKKKLSRRHSFVAMMSSSSSSSVDTSSVAPLASPESLHKKEKKEKDKKKDKKRKLSFNGLRNLSANFKDRVIQRHESMDSLRVVGEEEGGPKLHRQMSAVELAHLHHHHHHHPPPVRLACVEERRESFGTEGREGGREQRERDLGSGGGGDGGSLNTRGYICHSGSCYNVNKLPGTDTTPNIASPGGGMGVTGLGIRGGFSRTPSPAPALGSAPVSASITPHRPRLRQRKTSDPVCPSSASYLRHLARIPQRPHSMIETTNHQVKP